MIVDTSAIVAVIRNEPERAAFVQAMTQSLSLRMSATSYLEASIRIDAHNDPVASRRFDELIEEMGIQIEAVTFDQVRIARQAYRDFGKGRRNPAQLNFGDCFAYALAAATGEPLLFKGADFVHTDVKPAV
jgi:ribonuclease VapC